MGGMRCRLKAFLDARRERPCPGVPETFCLFVCS